MVDGYYNDPVTGRAFSEPCLPKATALRSPTFNDILNNGEGKSIETWTLIFRHLTDKAKEADAHTPVRGGWARDDLDTGPMEFATAMKTTGQVAFDSLNFPKRTRHRDKEGENGMEVESIGSGSAKRDSWFTHLWISLAFVKGEL